MPKIKIGTITYNRPHLLPRTVESVLAQTLQDFVYLIINNGSTDDTQSLLDHYCETDKRIHTISFEKNERGKDRLSAIQQFFNQFDAQYYAGIDDDDFMAPVMLETLHRLITEYDADIATVGSRYVYPDGSTKDKFIFDGVYAYNRIDAMRELLKREKFNASGGSKLYRSALHENFKYPPGIGQARDIHREYRIVNSIKKMVVTGVPLFYCGRHDSSTQMSGLDTPEQITPERMRQHLEANAMRTEWLTERMPEIKDFVHYSEISFMISLWERIHRLDVQSCFEIADEMRGYILRHTDFLSAHDFCSEREKEIVHFIDNTLR